jgi:hypothetical protein
MQWKVDLENLIAQTKAMIRPANAKSIRTTPPAELASADVLPDALPPDVLQSSILRPAAPSPIKSANAASMPQMTWRSPAREEITQRVAGFKAHQERMRREREDYYRETIAKTRALLQQDGKTNPIAPASSPAATRPD